MKKYLARSFYIAIAIGLGIAYLQGMIEMIQNGLQRTLDHPSFFTIWALACTFFLAFIAIIIVAMTISEVFSKIWRAAQW